MAKGIPPEKKEWIFIALNSTAEQGSGLGLFIIQRTLHKMGGHITETGTDGAHFTMYIPYQEREAMSRETDISDVRILVMDDKPDVLARSAGMA